MRITRIKQSEKRVHHLAAIYTALTAASEAILRATTPAELYQGVCHAAVDGGKFMTMAIIFPGRDATSFKVVATAGLPSSIIGDARHISADPTSREEIGLVRTAFRSGISCHSNDFLNDERTQPWHAVAQQEGIAAGAAVLLTLENRAHGVLLFHSAEKDAFDQEALVLIECMARDITFALNNFEREEKYRSIIENIEDPYYEVDLQGSVVHANSAFSRMLGFSESELTGVNHRDFEAPEVSSRVYKTFNEVYRTGVPARSVEWELLCKDGSKVTGEGSVHLIKNDSGSPIGFRGILRDVTERRQIEKALRESEARFRALTHLSSDWYWEQDTDFRYTRMEGPHTRTSAEQNFFLGKQPWEIGFLIQSPGGWKAHRELLVTRKSFRDVIMHRLLPNGRQDYISVSGEPVVDDDGRLVGYRGVSREITAQKVAEERIQYLATHDGLTKLPNRVMFSELLGIEIPAARRYQRNFAVMFIDLDRFKFVNDTLGHEAGDKLLQQITARFKQVLRASDVIARLGGDEFVVLLTEVNDAENVAIVARKILSAASKPIVLMGQECRVTASIGIAMFPEHGEDEQTLMKNADIAMYFAKEEGKNNLQFYSTDIKVHALERLFLEENLRRALEQQEFTLHYQPKFDLAKKMISGVEALLRWQNAQLGSVSPHQFIPIAEETGLIIPIGKWVLKTACEQNMAWQKQGLPPICIAVNLSVRQFADDHLLNDIATVLKDTGMAPSLLEIEITEGMLVHNPERAIQLLTAMKKMGIRLAIDDFGTGYSSLSRIKNFPIDTLKVDRSFILDIATNSEDQAIARAIIAMGKTLSLTIVVEGVETIEQENFLREHACDEMQGYYFSKPVTAEEFTTLLSAHPYPH